MNNIPFETAGLVGSEIDLFLETYNHLKMQLPVKFDHDKVINFDGFELFSHYTGYKVMASMAIDHSNGNAQVAFTKVGFPGYHTGYSQMVYRPNIYEMQAWIVATLNKDFGHVIIKQETLTDRITDLITHTELKFDDDKHFNKQFYVLASDHDKALSAMNFNFRNAVLDISTNDFLIEIIGNQLIIGNQKPINPEKTLCLAAFADKMIALR